jgi:basic membrane protein A
MKRFIAMALTAVMTLAGCSGASQPSSGETPAAQAEGSAAAPATQAEGSTVAPVSDTYELALVTDLGTIDDKSFNQGAWEGLVAYAEENGVTHKYYQPSEQSDDAYLGAIDLAVKGGAKIIVTPGYLFEVPVFLAQERYPDVNFILLDGSPHNEDYSVYETAANTVGVTYAEEQAGFLAGYAAVKDGYTNLGFMGGMAVPAVVRFGFGFVQGAEYAADELGIASIPMKYHYTGAFAATPEAQATAASWYNDGVEVIFACGGAVGNSVMSAADQAGAKVIGVDVDQSGESDTVITSAMKGLSASVYDCIDNYYNNKFPGGENLVFAANNAGVNLPLETSRFEKFSEADYEAIFALLASESITLEANVDLPVTDLPVTIVAITEVK